MCLNGTSAQVCRPTVVVCDETNVTQVVGPVGVTTPSGRALAGPDGVIRVTKCLEHLLDELHGRQFRISGRRQGGVAL